jgi:hypothetical protein
MHRTIDRVRGLIIIIATTACGSPPDTEHVAPIGDTSCVGLHRVSVAPGYCVKIVPKPNGPSVAYGPTCDDLTWLDTSPTCAAWVTSAPESIWVNDADVSSELWGGAPADCSCL